MNKEITSPYPTFLVLRLRSRTRKFALAFFTALITSLPPAAKAPSTQTQSAPTYRYRALDLGTLGGPDSAGCVPDCRDINNRGSSLHR